MARRPRPFKLPHSKVCIAEADSDNMEPFVQLHAGGTTEPKTLRRLAAWLLRAADWLERKKEIS